MFHQYYKGCFQNIQRKIKHAGCEDIQKHTTWKSDTSCIMNCLTLTSTLDVSFSLRLTTSPMHFVQYRLSTNNLSKQGNILNSLIISYSVPSMQNTFKTTADESQQRGGITYVHFKYYRCAYSVIHWPKICSLSEFEWKTFNAFRKWIKLYSIHLI